MMKTANGPRIKTAGSFRTAGGLKTAGRVIATRCVCQYDTEEDTTLEISFGPCGINAL